NPLGPPDGVAAPPLPTPPSPAEHPVSTRHSSTATAGRSRATGGPSGRTRTTSGSHVSTRRHPRSPLPAMRHRNVGRSMAMTRSPDQATDAPDDALAALGRVLGTDPPSSLADVAPDAVKQLTEAVQAESRRQQQALGRAVDNALRLVPRP